MRRLVCLLLVCLFTLPAQAQSWSNPPLFAVIGGDLYFFANGVPLRETHWGHNYPPIVSPDGHYIAYGSLPELLVELDATGEYPINYDQHPPTNIWIMNIATRDYMRIADQPKQIVGEEPRFSRRSDPVWSPDSTQIAWIEANFHDSEDGLVLKVYDLKTGETRRGVSGLAGAGGDAGFWTMPDTLYWGNSPAYAAWTWDLPEPFGDNNNGKVLYVLGEQAILRQRIVEVPASDTPHILDWHWVDYQGAWMIALQYPYGWRLWDTGSDALYQLDKPPFAETLNGTRLDIAHDAANNRDILTFADGRRLMLPENTQSYAISPDGRSVAYIEPDASQRYTVGRLMLWENGESRTLWDTPFDTWMSGISWSPLRWRVEETPSLIADPTPIPVPTQNGG